MNTKIIHGGDGINITGILAIAWGLPEICQVEGCENNTAAIIFLDGEESPTGQPYKLCICEEHYQKGVEEGRLTESFNF